MAGNRALSLLFRLITSKPLDRVTLFLLQDGVKRFRDVLPREIFGGLDSFFFRDMIGNIDMDNDGIPDSFRLTVTNAWFDQRITGIELSVDGRRVPAEKIIFRSPSGETRASAVTTLEFAPGEAMEIIAEGTALDDGLHLVEMTLKMELVSQIIPVLPVLIKDGVGDFPILDDCFRALPEWPPEWLEPGKAHSVPHIHYDVEWLKTREVFERIGRANLRELIRLMDEDPDMTFVIDQVPQLEPFRRADPEGFERIRELVGEGRIEPVNGMYSEPDTNLISGESLLRQSVAWQRYAMEWFGKTSRCGWLIDSFGMSGQLPQILSRSGSDCFAFSRARVKGDVPSEFLWEGIDGTRILATNMPRMYNVGHPMPTDRRRALRKMLKNYRYLRKRSASDRVFYPGGVDHGRPQGAYGEMIRAWNEEIDGAEFEFSSPSRFFDDLPAESLPVLRGEIQRELWGTYSARISLKQLNRECEFALLDAGKLATVGALKGSAYPGESLEGAWRLLMDNHFHDQICGCCTDEVAAGMKERFQEVLAITEGIMDHSARFLAGGEGRSTATGSRRSGEYTLLVFNPLSRPVSSRVEFDLMPPPGWRGLSVSAGDEELPVQVIDATRYGDGSLKEVRAGFRPRLPAIGYCLFRVSPSEGESVGVPRPVEVHGLILSNGLIRVEVNSRTGLIDRVILEGDEGLAQQEFHMGGANRLTLERDFGNLYEARAFGTTYLHPRRVDSVRVVRKGPLEGTIEVRGAIGKSRFIQSISVAAGSPRIDLETWIDFRNPGFRLRCVFPTGMRGGEWTHEIPYGCLERPGHELPAQNFVDLSDSRSGVTLVNLGIPGNKCYRGTMFLTLLRSTDRIFMWDAGPGGFELGEHVFRYSLYPHRAGWREAESVLEAYRCNNRPRAFVFDGWEPVGDRPETFGAVECDSPHVLVSVLECGDDGDVMIRAWETSGRPREVELLLGWEPVEAHKTDLLGNKEERLSLEGRGLSLSLRPFEIATVVLADEALGSVNR